MMNIQMVQKTNALLITLVTLHLAGCDANQQTRNSLVATVGGNDVAKSREDVKRLVDTNEPWLETSLNNMHYMFVAEVLPAYGSSRIDLHGWVYRQRSERWEKMFVVRTNGVGAIRLSVDHESGILLATGTANNKFLGKKVFQFDLNATEP